MKTYFFKVEHGSTKRGYNRTVKVYTQLNDNRFSIVDYDNEINTASYRGDYAIACSILNDKLGYRWSKNDRFYSLQNKNIQLIQLP